MVTLLKKLMTRKGKLLDVPLEDSELKAFFTNVEYLLRPFERLARAPSLEKRIFNIHGIGAVGKSSVLRMFRLYCKENKVAVALACGDESKSPVEVLCAFVHELEEEKLHFTAFQRSLSRYRTIQAKTEQESGKPTYSGEALKDAVKPVAEIIASEIPIAGPVASPFVGAGVGALVDWMSGFLSKNELDFFLNADKRLTDAFLEDMAGVASRCRVVLLLDAYEQITNLDDWVCNWAKKLHTNVLVVIAGRAPLGVSWDRKWPGWITQALTKELQPMSDEHMRTLVQRYYATVGVDQPEPMQVEKIVTFARGLPMVVITAARLWAQYGIEDFQEVRPRVIDDLVDRLMERTPETLRDTLAAAAAVRWFNKEVLGFLLGEKNIDKDYTELRRFPFIRSRNEGLALHEVVREIVNEYLRIHDPTRYELFHQKMVTMCTHKLSQLEENIHKPTEDRRKEQRLWTLEQVYHSFQLSESRGTEFLQQVFEEAFLKNRQFDFCRVLLQDAGSYSSDENSKRWMRYYESLIAIYVENDPERPRLVLESLLDEPDLGRELRANVLEHLAGVYWYFSLRSATGTEKAKQLYQQCLQVHTSDPNDIAGQTRALIWLGILHQRTEGKGEVYFQEALQRCKRLGSRYESTQAWLERELSISFRMQGRFNKSLTMVMSSADTFGRLGLSFDEAHSLMNYGMLLVYMGKLRQAEERFVESLRLFERGGHSRSYEQAWPLVGLADVELGRGKCNEALELCHKALEIWQDDSFGTAIAHGGLADVYCALGHWDLAVDHADRSLRLKDELDDKFGIGWSLNTKGKALLGAQRHQLALDCFVDGRRHMLEYGSWFGRSRLTLGICQVHCHRGDDNRLQDMAEDIEQWGSQYCFFHDLAHLAFLRGVLQFNQIKPNTGPASKEILLDQAMSYFASALACALKHNPFLLDSLLQSILVRLDAHELLHMEDKNLFITKLKKYWIDDPQLTMQEREARMNEDVGGICRTTVLEQLEQRVQG